MLYVSGGVPGLELLGVLFGVQSDSGGVLLHPGESILTLHLSAKVLQRPRAPFGDCGETRPQENVWFPSASPLVGDTQGSAYLLAGEVIPSNVNAGKLLEKGRFCRDTRAGDAGGVRHGETFRLTDSLPRGIGGK
jgi:hypothetical protein